MEGALVLEMARRAEYVAGVDHSAELIAAAEDRRIQSGANNITFGAMPADRVPFDDETFDTVVSREMLHRLDNPDGMLREMARVMRSAGKLFVADIVADDDPSRREVQEMIELVRFGPPINLHSLAELRALAAAAPLEIINQVNLTEVVDAALWLPPDRVDPATRKKMLRMLATTARKKTGEIRTHATGKSIAFERRWVLIIAAKTSSA